MIRRYYEEEMRYLHEAGKAFAQAFPDQARYLDVESITDRDPYVERLFEGFAVLTGRIRERLDDDFPELTEGLFRLLHPHFLRPFPSTAVLEFEPRPGMVQETTVLERGLEVRSGPVGPEGTVCRFQTVYDVALQPLRLLGAELTWPTRQTSTLTLRFELERGVEPAALDLNTVRLFLHDEPASVSTLYRFLTQHVTDVTARGGKSTVSLSGQRTLQPAGLGEDEGLVPYGRYSFLGYRLLQEYFAFRPKFWFVDLLGLDRLDLSAEDSEFSVAITFDQPFPETQSVRADHFRLHCTPIVNLFELDAEPLRLDHTRSELTIRPDGRRPRSVETYAVGSVTGVEDGTGRRHEYRPFHTFAHPDTGGRFYTERTRVTPIGRQTVLELGGFAPNGPLVPETLSVEVLGTNGTVPHELLSEGSITRPGPGYAHVAAFRNLTRPTRQLDPPTQDREAFHWQLLSHLAYNRMGVGSAEALVGVLGLYDWSGQRANARRLDGIQGVHWEPKEVLYRGAILRGAEVTIEVQEEHFLGLGDLALFGTVLSAFFSAYATINAFVHLTLVAVPSGTTYRWTPRQGERAPL